MAEIEKILALIEAANDQETPKLNKIERMVCDYFGQIPKPVPRYTRSLDALIYISPDNWSFEIKTYWNTNETRASATRNAEAGTLKSVHCASEGLARLHCILRAIHFERTGEKL